MVVVDVGFGYRVDDPVFQLLQELRTPFLSLIGDEEEFTFRFELLED